MAESHSGAPKDPCHVILLICVFFISILSLLALLPSAAANDPDPEQDFCVADLHSSSCSMGYMCKNSTLVNSDEFVFRGLRHAGNTKGSPTGFARTLASVLQFPALNTQGLCMVRADFAPGGVNVPHIHPRASELAFILEGTFYAGFVSTSNKLYAQILHQGDLMIIPRGLVHFQMNIGSTDGVIMGSLNSQNPGAQFVPLTLFGADIKDEVLEKSFQLSRRAVEELKAKFTPHS